MSADPNERSIRGSRDARGPGWAAAEPAADRGRLLELSDLTLAAYLRHLATHGGSFVEDAGLLLASGPHPQPNPYRNGALRLDDRLSVAEVKQRGRGFFGDRHYALWVREHGDADLRAWAGRAGLRDLGRLPQLMLDHLPEEPQLPEGVQLRQARDPQTQDDYLGLVSSAWGMGDLSREIAAQIFFDPASLDDENVAAFVAYYEDMPLSGAMTLVTHGVALGCQGATLRKLRPGQRLPPPGPPGQRRGLAEICLWMALKLSFEKLGAWCSLAQTSILGAPAWLRMGYEPLTGYERWLVQADV